MCFRFSLQCLGAAELFFFPVGAGASAGNVLMLSHWNFPVSPRFCCNGVTSSLGGPSVMCDVTTQLHKKKKIAERLPFLVLYTYVDIYVLWFGPWEPRAGACSSLPLVLEPIDIKWGLGSPAGACSALLFALEPVESNEIPGRRCKIVSLCRAHRMLA